MRCSLVAVATVAALAGCKHDLPSALSLPEEMERLDVAEAARVTDRTSALVATLAGDPLARRPRFPSDVVMSTVDDADTLRALAQAVRHVEGPGRDLPGGLRALHDRWPGTEANAILRGYRLGIADRILGEDPSGDRHVRELPILLTDLALDRGVEPLAKQPLAALCEGDPCATALRTIGDRWVLTTWLDGPDTPLGPVAEALRGPMTTRLADSLVGRIVLGRADGATADTGPGLADLRRATSMALERAAADRHVEQGAWADTRRAAAEELSVDDPVGALLERAVDRLAAGAADDRATGAALLAAVAWRLQKSCDETPCGGVDRVEVFGRVPRWSNDLTPLATTWRVIALKDAVDAMEVGHDTVLFPRAVRLLLDALHGTGVRGLPVSLLAARAPTPEAWQAIGSVLGAPGATSWPEVQVALGAHLAEEASTAASFATGDDRLRLERIAKRAVP